MNHRFIRRRAVWGALALGAAGMLLGITGIHAKNGGAQAEYARVYEPQTSLPLAATVCWLAGTDAATVAQEEVRPASALVYLDPLLRVLTEKDEEIAPALPEYLRSTSPAMIPVLYMRDGQTAERLYDYLKDSGSKDIFIAAGYEDAALVKRLASLPHVRGLIDFTGMRGSNDEILPEIIRITNASGAKVAMIPQSLASAGNVRTLQDRLITVWAQSDNGKAAIIGALTCGVNGIVVTDYGAAYEGIGFFRDDAPTLLRLPRIIGHRGMPSEYAENTLMSVRGAYQAGTDMIECDIYLSRDGQLYINHDASLKRLFNRGDVGDSERLTLAELQSIPFSFTGANGVPNANNQPAASSRFGTIREDASLRIPALREYFTEFKDTSIVIFIEIKSHNPAIVQALKALCEEMGTVGQTAVITFNAEILEAMHRDWPEMSVGALGSEGALLTGGRLSFRDYGKVLKKEGPEKALEQLLDLLAPANATYHPKYTFTYALAQAGRHRGLTVWPWTYNDPQTFADAYLKGVYGLTTNFAWWATDLAAQVNVQDVQLAVGQEVPLPDLLSRSGNTAAAEKPDLLTISGDAVKEGVAVHPGETVLIWRTRQNLVLDGRDYGPYYLYSQPFMVRVD